ncbi:hypothetical protein CVIRNUC_004667 [Coccomyxa viridis]|uniref:VIT family protein n=1 Tax=Coccomyxa viridis TaxID=1274662 RepID=A0AAV1I413_9CHLO|nr:hypothetical protein CVIRNUC_004667 [Coccomyxa viridis]
MPGNEASEPLLASNGANPDVEAQGQEPQQDQESRPDEHEHYSNRANWLRAAVLGANDGLVSVAAIMLGVGAGSTDQHTLLLSGISALVAGALSMAAGEYISVASQKDTELADVDKERQQQEAGPRAREEELEELAQIYVSRGLDYGLAKQVAEALSRTKDMAVQAHARDELGIDLEDLDEKTNPFQAAFASMISFTIGGIIPLLGGVFIRNPRARLASVAVLGVLALALFGAIGAWLGGAKKLRAATRVVIGGVIAFVITYLVGLLTGEQG